MPGLALRPFALMDTTDITRMIVRPTATMGRTILWAACLSARGPGITAGTDAVTMAGPGGHTAAGDMATVVGDMAIGRDMPTVVVGDMEIAQGTPIGAVRGAAMAVAASAATVRAQSTAVAAPAVTARAHSTVVAAPTVVAGPTAVAAFMVVGATEAATGKSNQLV